MPNNEVLEIVRLGAQGDGVADTANGPVFVPFALPGERWRTLCDGTFERVGDAAVTRRAAPCPHFGRCGGCVAQHMSDDLYADWKASLVRQALAHQGIDTGLGEMWRAEPASRRRVALSGVVLAGGGIGLGFRAAASHAFVAIDTCTIAVPEIVDVLPALSEIVATLAGGSPLPSECRVHVLAADNGLDVWIEGAGRQPAAGERETMARQALGAGLVRLRAGRDEIYQQAAPLLKIGGGMVRVPAGGFVQAVGEAEAVLAERVVKALGRAKQVADLFSGLGAFSLPLARRARVLAVDNDAEALAALDEAVRHTQGLKPIDILRRDLFREPLSRGELNAFDGVVFDPPRAGAIAQAAALAKSKVPVIVAVSCNPATLARDLRVLIDGGYTLDSVTPVDQFVFSAHIEVVAVLRR